MKKDEFQGDIEIVKLDSDDKTILYQNSEQTITSQGYVFFGKEDLQFNYLLELYVNSPTHNAIVNSLSFMMYGDGLNFSDIIDPKDNKKALKDWNIFGNACFQVTADDIFHMPVNFIRAEPIDPNTGNVEWYQFSTDFSESRGNNVKMPAWSKNWKPTEEFPSAIYYVKTYTPNAFYYGIAPFNGGTSYMEQETLIASFMGHYIRNNFSVNVLVNFNNGTTDPISRKKNLKAIKEKFTGVDGDTIIVAHNKSKEHAATIDTVSVPNGSEQYQYATDNARSQIIVSHQITSPLLVGIREGSNGLSSNSAEIIEARLLLEEMKIKPNQELFADAFNEIKGRTDIEYLTGIKPEAVEVVKENVELKKVKPNEHLAEFVAMGVNEMAGYQLILDTIKVDDLHDEVVTICDEFFKSENVELASSGKATPQTKSKQDKNGYAVRYRYGGNKIGQRAFCSTMLSADKLYTKENIVAMRHRPVNPGFGKGGTNTYSIWNYQGGGKLSPSWKFGTCTHHWVMEVYVAEELSPSRWKPLTDKISNAKAIRNGISPLQNPVNVHTSNWDQSRNV